MDMRLDAIQALRTVRQFVSPDQYQAMRAGLRGEESQYFQDKFMEIGNTIEHMPKTYDQDGLGDQAVAHLHYFMGSGDWYITEKDSDPVNESGGHDGQIQAFGLADLGYGAELGYISIAELIANGAELDLHFTPQTLAQLKDTRQAA